MALAVWIREQSHGGHEQGQTGGEGTGCHRVDPRVGDTLWATGPGGLHVFSPDGKHLGTINPDSGDPISNCNWGDDGSTLYMTVNHQIARIKTNTKGAGW